MKKKGLFSKQSYLNLIGRKFVGLHKDPLPSVFSLYADMNNHYPVHESDFHPLIKMMAFRSYNWHKIETVLEYMKSIWNITPGKEIEKLALYEILNAFVVWLDWKSGYKKVLERRDPESLQTLGQIRRWFEEVPESVTVEELREKRQELEKAAVRCVNNYSEYQERRHTSFVPLKPPRNTILPPRRK